MRETSFTRGQLKIALIKRPQFCQCLTKFCVWKSQSTFVESSAAWAVQHLRVFPRLWLHLTIACLISQKHVRIGRNSQSESDASVFGQSSQLRQVFQFSGFSSNCFSRREFEFREDIERLVGYTRGQHASGKSICEFGAHKILSQYSIASSWCCSDFVDM